MSSPQVGDVLTTIDQLDACPVGTIVRSVHGVTVEKGFCGGWFRPGHAEPFDALELFRIFDDRWEVVWVPPVTEVTFDALVKDQGCDGVVRPSEVRVKVRKIRRQR